MIIVAEVGVRIKLVYDRLREKLASYDAMLLSSSAFPDVLMVHRPLAKGHAVYYGAASKARQCHLATGFGLGPPAGLAPALPAAGPILQVNLRQECCLCHTQCSNLYALTCGSC